jgi:hypothetical protein
MIESHLKSQTGEQASARLGTRESFQIRKGQFVGIVEPQGDHYSFLVRDLRRERPTIYGYGVSDRNAIAAVTQLLDALASHSESASSAASG